MARTYENKYITPQYNLVSLALRVTPFRQPVRLKVMARQLEPLFS
jgi:hypothetical protein